MFVVSNQEDMWMEIENGPAAHLKKGDMLVVPKGVKHKPVTEAEAEILMVEMEGTINTGDVDSD